MQIYTFSKSSAKINPIVSTTCADYPALLYIFLMSFDNLFCQAVILCLLSVSFYNMPEKTGSIEIEKKDKQE